MSTTKRSIVMDESLTKRRSTKQNKRSNGDLEDILQQQRIKEKQLLLKWKAARDAEKKNQLIMRKQSRDVCRKDKERFNETDETDYEICGEPEDRYIFKCCPRYREHSRYY
jgi:hypothetical protein